MEKYFALNEERNDVTETLILSLFIPLVDHVAELPVVELVVTTLVELCEGHLDLLIRQIFAN